MTVSEIYTALIYPEYLIFYKWGGGNISPADQPHLRDKTIFSKTFLRQYLACDFHGFVHHWFTQKIGFSYFLYKHYFVVLFTHFIDDLRPNRYS